MKKIREINKERKKLKEKDLSKMSKSKNNTIKNKRKRFIKERDD